eukprot:6228844-Pyramimonas_sp.AAC.1
MSPGCGSPRPIVVYVLAASHKGAKALWSIQSMFKTFVGDADSTCSVSYTHLRAHETGAYL